MKKLQVPFNLDRDIFDVYTKYQDDIAQVYFACHPDIFPSAREAVFPEPEELLKLQKDLCDHLYTLNIESYILFNGTYVVLTNDKYLEIYEELSQLVDHHLSGVVVANPILAHWVHNYFPQLKVKFSILSHMDTIGKIQLVETLGYVSEICLPLSYNEDKAALKELKEKTHLKYSILVNSLCRAHCPLYGWHHCAVNSTTRLNSEQFNTTKRFLFQCSKDLPEDETLAAYISPSHLHEFDDIVDFYKLEDRTMSTKDIDTMLYYYTNREDPDNKSKCIHGSCMSYKVGI